MEDFVEPEGRSEVRIWGEVLGVIHWGTVGIGFAFGELERGFSVVPVELGGATL